MKIGVISDSHGDLAAIRRAAELMPEAAMWLHAGDYSQDAEYLASLVKVPVLAARGNSDGQAAAKLDEFVAVEGKEIWLTHGHRHRVKHGLEELAQWGREYGMDIVVYGHTHIPMQRQLKDLLLFNPGSARGNGGTFGVITLQENSGEISSEIIKL